MKTMYLEFGKLKSKAVVCLSSRVKEDPQKILTNSELQKYHSFKSQSAANSFFLGRYCAKYAYSIASNCHTSLNKINIVNGIFGQPFFEGLPGFNTSISHCNNEGAAIVFEQKYLMGIDICSPEDAESIFSTFGEKDANVALAWTMQEALAKAISTGITIPLEILSPHNIQQIHSHTFRSEYINFPQYQSIAWIDGTNIVAVCYPRNLVLNKIFTKSEKKFQTELILIH